MCGILGTIPASEKNLFAQSLQTLHHRGPDGYGIAHISNEVSLGHKRLSILDLSDNGKQPMFSSDNRYSIVFNGEIFNFIEIREDLKKLGHNFKSNSDTEVLLAAFVQWGQKCILKFNGFWAFAIWDSLTKELFISRDRYGQKPLYYTIQNGKFIFASEMKAILPFLKQVEVSDHFHWMKSNVFYYESSEKCLIKGINRFKAGYNGWYKDGELITKRYWNTLDNLVQTPRQYEDQVEEFRHLFFDACKLRMRSDVTIGTALSGGLDSSATIAAMANLAKENQSYASDWQHAFVATFPDTPLDESYYADKVTHHLGIESTHVRIDPREHWANIEHYFYLFEDLYITSPLPMIMLYGAVKKGGVTVTLDGHGADEMLSGYQQGNLEALWDAKFDFKRTKDLLNIYHESLIKDDTQFKPQSFWSPYLHYMKHQIPKKLLRGHLPSIDKTHKQYAQLDNMTQYLYSMFHENILPTLLRNYDRYSMINGVEIRMPFMDYRIVNFLNSIPSSSKIGKGYTKRIVRDALAPYLPDEVLWRKSKVGFNSPIVDWMQKDLKEWFEDTISSRSFLESTLLETPKRLSEQIFQITNGKNSDFKHAADCWTKLSVYLWEKAFLNTTKKAN